MSYLTLPRAAFGQVIPDGTTLTPDPGACTVTCTIRDGTSDATGTNLFHSFQEFSVPGGGTVFFDHAPTIRNIFSRVTGSNPSTIDGTLSTNFLSEANLFLLNPNGIIFGPDSSLDIGGSFVATTAAAIQFGTQGSFSALETDLNPALLTVAPSAFLFNQSTVAPIVNQSIAPPLPLAFAPGLGVRSNQNLVLVGGDIILEPAPANQFGLGGGLSAPSGRIELGGLKEPGSIQLDITDGKPSLAYGDNAPLADISIRGATLDVSDFFNGAGDIVATANTFSALKSSLTSIILLSSENAGNILIQTNEEVSLKDFTNISSNTSGSGTGGTIKVITNSFSVEESSGLSVSTFGPGSSGQIIVEAETIALSDDSGINSEASLGDPGKIQISTASLQLDNVSQISTLTDENALDKDTAGNIDIEARDSITLLNNSTIQSQTLGQRNASPITLTTSNLNIQSLSSISASTSGTGSGGPININALDTVTLNDEGTIAASSTGSGPAGDISIRADNQLRVDDGAAITVSGTSSGNSGILRIISDIVVLDDGQLLASVAEGEDGNINLSTDALVLRGDSLISAEAFNNANGGNVDITAPFIIALFPDGPNGSDIIASADTGNGGRITIQANTLFNIAENQAIDGNRTNDLDATSGTGIDGEVIITTLEVDPDEGTLRLPPNLAAPPLREGCQAGSNGQFVTSGQGGLTPTPYDSFSNSGIQEDIHPPGQTIAEISEQPSNSLIEAVSWHKNKQGAVVLAPANTTYQSACQQTVAGGTS
ncbi:MAG: filamentous hemagglutinin N-terminal domain-containing protein [Cyanobacteria bacterium P01_D01_bin.156]